MLDVLKPGPTSDDRPEIVNRVFQKKLLELMEDLSKGDVLGRCVADLYVIERQKRGLPHTHILIFLHPEDKPKTPEHVDRMVSSEGV